MKARLQRMTKKLRKDEDEWRNRIDELKEDASEKEKKCTKCMRSGAHSKKGSGNVRKNGGQEL